MPGRVIVVNFLVSIYCIICNISKETRNAVERRTVQETLPNYIVDIGLSVPKSYLTLSQGIYFLCKHKENIKSVVFQ